MKTAATIEKIADRNKRARAAAQTLREARAKAEAARARRDYAALVMIAPFVRTVAPFNARQEKARDAYYGYYTVNGRRYTREKTARREAAKVGVDAVYHEPTMSTDDYYAALDRIKVERREALTKAGVTIEPADVYALIGVSRGLFVRMMKRMPPDTPDASEYDGDPAKDAKAAAKDVQRFEAIENEVRPIRDEVLDDLLNGISGPAERNADIARLTDLTTARVAQLRLGTR